METCQHVQKETGLTQPHGRLMHHTEFAYQAGIGSETFLD